jgi:hypothetical protein
MNKTIKIATLTPPSQPNGWGKCTDQNGTEYSIAPDKWDGVKDILVIGESVELDSYQSSNGKYYIKAPNKPKGGGMPKKDTTGMAVGSALNNAVALIAAGKVELKDLQATAKRILDISIELKSQYEGKI